MSDRKLLESGFLFAHRIYEDFRLPNLIPIMNLEELRNELSIWVVVCVCSL